MVFGTTYCAISHLPIEDGDKCILIPLGFNMKYSFNITDKADINAFMYLYSFVDEPQEVIYNGNPDDIEYLDKNYERSRQYELYMLVSLDFYSAIQSEYMNDFEWKISDLRSFKTCKDIYIQAQEVAEMTREELEINIKTAEGVKKEEMMYEYLSGGIVPDWMVAVYKVAMFMDGLGMIPYPNHVVDQHGRNELYEKMRADCISKRTKVAV